MVSEDFQVMEARTTHILGLLKKLGIQDETILEKKDVDFCQAEVLMLLGRSLLSKNPLSQIFLGVKKVKLDRIEVKELETKIIKMKDLQTKKNEVEEIQTEIKEATADTDVDSNLKLILNKDNGEMLYAEAEEEFVNLLFSFLTFPLASVIKFLNGQYLLGCMDNSNRIFQPLIVNGGVRYDCKSMLLNPDLPPMFGCGDQILKLDEMPPVTLHYSGEKVYFHNPKHPPSGAYPGGGFVEDSLYFILTGDLVVTLKSTVTAISIIKRLQVPIANLEVKTIVMREEEALKILKASSSGKRKRSIDSQDLEHASCQKCD